MEVVGLVTACGSVLRGIVEVIERTTAAWDRQKNGVSYLNGVCTDVKTTIRVVELVSKDEELQKDHVAEAVKHVSERATELDAIIRDLDEKSQIGGGFRKFIGHLKGVQAEKERLEKMRRELNDAKSTLILSLQMAQVGLMRSMGQTNVVVNVEAVARVEKLFGTCPELGEEGLRLSELLRARGRRSKDGWQLRDQDLEQLAKPPPYEYQPPPQPPRPIIERIVKGNIAKLDSTIFGADIGRDGGGDEAMLQADRVVVVNNTAESGSTIFGAPMSYHNASRLLELQGRLRASVAQPQAILSYRDPPSGWKTR